jgi:signal peptidase I
VRRRHGPQHADDHRDPRGEYFMLGDNRGDSDDSRFWGPIPGSWIIGEVFATYWPPDRIGIF